MSVNKLFRNCLVSKGYGDTTDVMDIRVENGIISEVGSALSHSEHEVDMQERLVIPGVVIPELGLADSNFDEQVAMTAVAAVAGITCMIVPIDPLESRRESFNDPYVHLTYIAALTDDHVEHLDRIDPEGIVGVEIRKVDEMLLDEVFAWCKKHKRLVILHEAEVIVDNELKENAELSPKSRLARAIEQKVEIHISAVSRADLIQACRQLPVTLDVSIQALEHDDALWNDLANARIHMVTTNLFHEDQERQYDSVQEPISWLYAAGVNRGHISLMRMMELCATNVAMRFGQYPHKGALIPGADADFTVLVANEQWQPTGELMLDKKTYKGQVVETWLKGEQVYRKQVGLNLKSKGSWLCH
ncbi:hypothetical protein JW960_08970 [candidate division KSB1 bacterium]|nr:hypothetical protein [candidate division KSB1 bacterium]